MKGLKRTFTTWSRCWAQLICTSTLAFLLASTRGIKGVPSRGSDYVVVVVIKIHFYFYSDPRGSTETEGAQRA